MDTELLIQIEHVLVACAAFVTSFGAVGALVIRMGIRNAVWRREVEIRMRDGDRRFADHAKEDERQRGRLDGIATDVRAVRDNLVVLITDLEHLVPNMPKRSRLPGPVPPE